MRRAASAPLWLECGNPVAADREEVVSDLILAGFAFAPLAVRKSRGFTEFYELQSDLRSEGVAVRVKNRILRGIEEEEKRGHG